MVANTDQRKIGRLIALCGSTITLVQSGKRNDTQVDELITALQGFKSAPKPPKDEYPGKFGNRCCGCGGFIDDGGICNCRWDHWNKVRY